MKIQLLQKCVAPEDDYKNVKYLPFLKLLVLTNYS